MNNLTQNLDGMNALVSSINKKNEYLFRQNESLQYGQNYIQYRELYENNAIAGLVVDMVVKDMVREWIKIDNDDDKILTNFTKQIELKQEFEKALILSRVYGGALLLMLINDGQKLDMPLNERTIKSIDGLTCYDVSRIGVKHEQGDAYNRPTYYKIRPYQGGNEFIVHRSRVLRFEGDTLTPETAVLNDGWGASVLYKGKENIQHLANAYTSSSGVLTDFVQKVVKIVGLNDILLTKEGEQTVNARLHQMDFSAKTIKTILLGDGETYDKVTANVAGIDKMIEVFQTALAAIYEVPVTRLFGQSAAGLNATGEVELLTYYNNISYRQEMHMMPQLDRILSICAGFLKFKYNGFTFNQLWQPTAKEEAEIGKIRAETHAIYYNMGVIESHQIGREMTGVNNFSGINLTNEEITTLEMDAGNIEDGDMNGIA